MLAGVVAFGACVVVTQGVERPSASPAARQAAIHILLEAYERGSYVFVARELAQAPDQSALRRELERHGAAWTDAAGAERRRARRLVAATLALEMASLRLWPEDVDPLVEWGCGLLRRDSRPDQAERHWQLASVALFGRARDDGRIVTRAGRDAPLGAQLPPRSRPADHVAHARARFPDEPRFRLAAAMLAAVAGDTEPARDVAWKDDAMLPRDSNEARRRARARAAVALFVPLVAEPSLAAEVEMRLGYLRFTLNEIDAALAHFARADSAGDPFVVYLARFLAGRAHDRRGEHDRANAMYRAALEVMPRTASASQALAANQVLRPGGDPAEAYALIDAATTTGARAQDPWHQFGYGDFRLLPDLMARVREALR
jgi:tetratricopeptide (TPR) repeat protein